MYGFFLTLLILDGLFLATVVLLQAGKGGGLAAMGGGGGTLTEGVLGGRQATNFLTKATWVSGGIFMVLALVLAILSSRAERPGSILQGEFQSGPVAPVPVLPAPVEELIPGSTEGSESN
jgi:preprotein translocase subunit SecG